MSDEEPQGDLIVQANGRNRYLRDRGEVKTPDLMDALIAELDQAREIIAYFLLWVDPACKMGPSETLDDLRSRARAFIDKAGK